MVQKIGHIPSELKQIFLVKNYKILNVDSELFIFCSILIIGLEVCHYIDVKFQFTQALPNMHGVYRWTVYISAVTVILLFGLLHSKGFIYFQF